MLMLDVIQFCDDNYKNSETEYRCESCKNECTGSCEKCLEDIHFDKTDRRYNCDNIINYYVCKYAYKYSSEIETIFETSEKLRNLSQYNIMSIGCGPATDLFGIINYVEENELNKVIQYLGVDLNEKWKLIHNKINDIGRQMRVKTRFLYNNIFDIIGKMPIRENTWRPNILILQYVISDMVKYNEKEEIFSFIDKLIDNIVKYMPSNSFIILNDINHNKKARDYFEYMHDCINKKYEDTTCLKSHFNNNNRFTYSYGNIHINNCVTTMIPRNIIETYNPWAFCSSAQIIIHKRT